jgi:hypothetical protein
MSEAEFLDEIQTKVLRVFLLAVLSHLYGFALRFLFNQTHATSHVFLQTHTISYVVVQFSYCTLYRRKEENIIETIPHSL